MRLVRPGVAVRRSRLRSNSFQSGLKLPPYFRRGVDRKKLSASLVP
jgi:hypothetical protein